MGTYAYGAWSATLDQANHSLTSASVLQQILGPVPVPAGQEPRQVEQRRPASCHELVELMALHPPHRHRPH